MCYRVYLLAENEQIDSQIEMAFESDDDAILDTALRSYPYAVEIWHHDRQVRRFAPGDLAG